MVRLKTGLFTKKKKKILSPTHAITPDQGKGLNLCSYVEANSTVSVLISLSRNRCRGATWVAQR